MGFSAESNLSSCDFQDWLEQVAKDLKVDNLKQLKRKLSDATFLKELEGIDLEPFENDLVKSCTLESFPSQIHIWHESESNIDVVKPYLANQALLKLESSQSAYIDTTCFSNYSLPVVNELATAMRFGLKYDGNAIVFKTTTDSRFFFQIAKLRAFRYIAEKVLESDFIIVAQTSAREFTLYDPWVNILRSSTSSQVAFLGGADFVDILPFDYLLKLKDQRSQRLAQNIFDLHLRESHLKDVSDPLKGSFIVEKITTQIIDQVWNKLQATQDIHIDELEEMSTKNYLKKQQLIATGELKITGVNSFPNADEKFSDLYPKEKLVIHEKSFTLRRDAQSFESLRFDIEKRSKNIILLQVGAPANISARAQFGINCLEAIGLKVKVIERALDDCAIESDEDVVLCALDEDYSHIINHVKAPRLFHLGSLSLDKSLDCLYMGCNLMQFGLKHFGVHQ